jgi:glycosyltransferase involved in cell wall biosynthesis
LEQSSPPAEIIITDDGSLTPQQAQELGARWPACVKIYARPHAGQAACTNHSIRRAQSDFLLLTCADIIAPRNLLQLHRDAHATRGDDVAVLGPLPYARSVPMTPLMRYLSVPGVQFCFNDMTDVENVNPMHCYAPNVSVSRATLLRVGLFDEGFTYGLQDVDLGRRLGLAGVRFVLEPRAYAFHAQGTTLSGYLQRQRRVGQATVRWLEKYPDAAMAAQLAGALRAALQQKHAFEEMVTQALAAYMPYDSTAVFSTEKYTELFRWFGQLFGLAVGMGALDKKDRLRAILPLYGALRKSDLGALAAC